MDGLHRGNSSPTCPPRPSGLGDARRPAVDPALACGLNDPSLVQIRGPRFNVYVVAARDVAAFTLGRLPTDARGRRRAEELARRAAAVLDDGAELPMGEVERRLDLPRNALRHAAATGTLLLRWDGARHPTVRLTTAPAVAERDARHDLVRRHLHVLGPSTPAAFARWAGVSLRHARTTFAELTDDLLPVRTPLGEGWMLLEDEEALRATDPAEPTTVRLLPSGDAYWLLHDEQRELLVPDPTLRGELWTSRVWPGALLLGDEIGGTWRRTGPTLAIAPWRPLTPAVREAVEAEAASLPLPHDEPVAVRWTR